MIKETFERSIGNHIRGRERNSKGTNSLKIKGVVGRIGRATRNEQSPPGVAAILPPGRTTRMNDQPPKGFGFVSGLCIALGAIGVLTNFFFLFMSISHGSSVGILVKTSIFWMSLFHVIRDGAFVYGGISVKKRERWAGNLVIFCASTSLVELFYNTAALALRGMFTPSPSTLSFLIIPLLLQGSILFYFTQKPVRAYLSRA